MAKKIVTYDCPVCSISHDSINDARDCCFEEIEPQINWGCDSCKNEFDTEHEANECCANKTLDKFEGRNSSEK
ncbi:hypothetical protein LCGC14_0970260 [marine sediment metagenome]|uniref:Uncharacterized protein n=1 Tax=marine sediment metagenome TaxID=412755 RepID=A0A0F9RIA9_9ZZZZ